MDKRRRLLYKPQGTINVASGYPCTMPNSTGARLYGYNVLGNASGGDGTPDTPIPVVGLGESGSIYITNDTAKEPLMQINNVTDEIDCVNQRIIRRIGIVDMGTLTWEFYSVSDKNKFVSAKLTNSVNTGYPRNINMSSAAGYTIVAADNATDKTLMLDHQNVWIYDTNYTDAATFKSAMSGVTLYYELATPTYEYLSYFYTLDWTGKQPLYKIGNVADEIDYANQRIIRRIGKVDLGAITWNYDTDCASFGTYYFDNRAVLPATNGDLGNILCASYKAMSWNTLNNFTLGITLRPRTGSAKRLLLRNSAYGIDFAALKASLSGVYLYYELVTPTYDLLTLPDLRTTEGTNIMTVSDGTLNASGITANYYKEI